MNSTGMVCRGRSGWTPSLNLKVNDESADEGIVALKQMSDMQSAVVMDPNNPMCLEGIVSLLVQFGYVRVGVGAFLPKWLMDVMWYSSSLAVGWVLVA
jgi:hypothetical protein